MKVVIFGQGELDKIGGVQYSYVGLLNHLCKKGHEITFFSHFAKNPGQEYYYQYPSSVKFVHFTFNDDLETREMIKKLTKDEEPDVVLVCNSARNAFIMTASLYALKYPVVLSVRGSDEYCLWNLWTSLLQRHTAHFCAEYTHFLMPSYSKALPKYLRKRIVTIPSPIEQAKSKSQPETKNINNDYIILYTGRLSPEKNLPVLIHAFSKVAYKYKNWRLDIYGSGMLKEFLQELITSLNLTQKVFLKGNLENINLVFEVYQHANIFVLPSNFEGCPLALREAMAHGLPVVGFSDCSGTNEIIMHEKNGILVSEDNKVDGLADALEQLILDPKKRSTLGKQGIIDVEKYNPEKIHNDWEALLLKAAKYKGKKKRLLKFLRFLQNPVSFLFYRKTLKNSINTNKLRPLYLYYYSISDTLNILFKYRNHYWSLFGCSLFNFQYYNRMNYKEVKEKGIDPLLHYITKGWRDGKKPSENFSLEAYYEEHSIRRECEPLYHYYVHGRQKNKLPYKEFDKKENKKFMRECSENQEIITNFSFLQGIKLYLASKKCMEWRKIYHKK